MINDPEAVFVKNERKTWFYLQILVEGKWIDVTSAGHSDHELVASSAELYRAFPDVEDVRLIQEGTWVRAQVRNDLL